MVAKVITGKTIRGVISYNEHKVKEGSATCILARKFSEEAGTLCFKEKLDTFLYYTKRNPNTRTNSVHISLNFDPKEKLTDNTLGQIAESYLNKIGFKDQPFLVYRHFDAAHPHIHIVTTNVRLAGRAIRLNNIGKDRSEPARKEIEFEFNLVKATGNKKSVESIKAADLTRAIYGKSETKRAISNIVGAVTRSYKFTSIHELNAVLKQFNVTADRGQEGTHMYNKNGLRYSLLNEYGKCIGVPIKASSIYGKPTLTTLSQQFEVNKALREPHKSAIRNSIDRFIVSKQNSLNDFVNGLASQNIYTVIRQNTEGRVYGMTFIDNSTKCVFNGSDLGKQYSAQGILGRLNSSDTNVKTGEVPRMPVKEDAGHTAPSFVPHLSNSQSELLRSITDPTIDHSNTPYELRKQRKRKGRRI